jgi:endonuclease III-like uncharacterized protein
VLTFLCGAVLHGTSKVKQISAALNQAYKKSKLRREGIASGTVTTVSDLTDHSGYCAAKANLTAVAARNE